MNTIVTNSNNSKMSDPHKLLINLTDKIDLRRKDKYIALSNISIYYKWKNTKKSYKNNKFKISAPTWNEEFELLDGSYSISYIQDYFENILKKHKAKTVSPSIRICIYTNKIENRITSKIKTEYFRELLTLEKIKLPGSTKSKIQDENGENVPDIEITGVALMHCNVVNNNYKKNRESCMHLFLINCLVNY